MKHLNAFLMMGLITALTLTTTSCEKVEGCTDPNALNYRPDATKDDFSCLYDTADDWVTKSGEITADETWTSDNVYRLKGRVLVTGGATLTIEPGTIIKAEPGQGSFASALVINRSGMINASGTSTQPIIFTSTLDEILPADVTAGDFRSPNLTPIQNGLWGGVIILGEAPISAQNDQGTDATELQIEGIPTAVDARYGGNDPTDNSGVFTYVSIRHGGSNIGAGNEINGLTLGGVGSGTIINNIEIVGNQDDGIEWFGGDVSLNNVLVWNAGDDGLDTDQDWIGNCTNFIVITPRGGSAFELDGPEGTQNRGTHQFTNGIVYAGDDIDHLVDWDAGTNAGVKDVYFYGLDPSYTAIADDPSTPDDNEEFNPIESFGGDGTGDNSNWEYTLAANGALVTEIFTGVPMGILTEVAENGNSVGPNSADFAWTWASQSGTLALIGL